MIIYQCALYSVSFYLCAGTKALFSDFHREKAWDEWIQKEHRVADKEDALAKLKAIATSLTTQQFEEAVKALMASHTWEQNPVFQSWFSDMWLSKAKVSI